MGNAAVKNDYPIDELTELIVEATESIPDNIELVLLKHISTGTADAEKIRNIVTLYKNNAIEEATLQVDMLDGIEDGKAFGTRLEGGDVPRPRLKRKADPD